MDSRWVRRGVVVGWSLLGGVIIAAFFIASFFEEFSPLPVGDGGAVLLLVPLLTGFLLGALLTDAEVGVAAAAGVLAATAAVGIVALFIVSPAIAGVAEATQPLIAFSIFRIAISTVILFPIVVVGTVVGRGFGDVFLPSQRVRSQLQALREETRRWHETLERVERRKREESPRDPEDGAEKD